MDPQRSAAFTPASPGGDLLEPEEVARMLGVSVQTLSHWRSSRARPLPFIRLGRLIRYRRDDVLGYINDLPRFVAALPPGPPHTQQGSVRTRRRQPSSSRRPA
jgi:excisionase family DNA binding protein